MNQNKAQYRITVPLQKSARDDGWYIIGDAAGTGVDLEGQEFDSSALDDIVNQINSEAVPLKDWHSKNSILSEMGSVGKAWRDGDRVKIEARLDEDHPTSQWLWKKLSQKKQFGLSVEGGVLGVKPMVDHITGKINQRLFKPFIREVSLTTKPVWSPSFGTVIQKAIDEASIEEEQSMDEETVDETTASADSAQTDTTAEAVVETTTDTDVETTEAPVVETETAETTSAPETVVTEVSKSLDPSKVALFTEYYQKMGELLAEMAPATIDTTSQDTTPVVPVEKSETVEETQETFEIRLEKAVDEKVASLKLMFETQLDALREKIPAVVVPAVLQKSEEEEMSDLRKTLNSGDPRDRMRLGFAATHNELNKFNRG